MQNNSKNDFISKKASELIASGVPHKEALTQAYDAFYAKQYNNGGDVDWSLQYRNGGVPQYQFAGTHDVPNTIGFTPSNPSFQTEQTGKFNDYSQNLANKYPLPNTNVNGFQYDPNAVNTTATVSTPKNENPYSLSPNAGSGYQTDEKGDKIDNFQFYNPYGGSDLGSAAYTLGQGIQTGNGLETLGSGLKLATGLARNAFAGAGQANRRNYIMQDYQNRQRENSVPQYQAIGENGGYFAEGGINDPIKIASQNAPQIVQNTVGIGDAPISDNPRFNTKKIVHYQPGVMNDRMGSGFYLYSKKSTDPGFNVDRDREFIKNSEMNAVQRTPEWASYIQTQHYQEGGYYQNNPAYSFLPPTGLIYQDGGQQPSPEQIIQIYAQMSQQDPQAIMQQLQQMSPEQQQQAIAQMSQAIQQGQQQNPQEEQAEGQMSNPQEEAQEVPQMQSGGQIGLNSAPTQNNEDLHKTLTGEYTTEQPTNKPVVAQIEKNEFLQKPDGSITKALGETHEKGGINLDEDQIPQGSRIISDHLKLGGDYKLLEKSYGLKLSKDDTYAKVLDKWTTKSGLTRLNNEQEVLIKDLEKQAKILMDKPQAEKTVSLNINYIQKQIKALDDKKAPLEEIRKQIFDNVFKLQEASKPVEEQTPIKQTGGTQTYNGDMVMGYNREKPLTAYLQKGGVPMYQDGTQTPINPLVTNSTNITNFGNEPRTVSDLPYTARDVNPNQIWQGANYENVWVPLVQETMSDPEQAKKVDEWLTTNKGKYSANIQKQLEGKTGEARYKKIQELATDKYPGVFHNAVREALIATKPPVVKEDTSTPDTVNNAKGRTQYGLLSLPDQSTLMPDSLQGAMLQNYRPTLTDAPRMSPDQAIQEIRRQESVAMEGTKNLPDAQRASTIAQIQANTQNELGKVISGTEAQNVEGAYKNDLSNADKLDKSQLINNQYGQTYQNEILKADATTQQDLRNWINHNTAVNVANFNKVENMNALNNLYGMKYTDQGVQNYNDWKPSYNGVTEDEYKQKLYNSMKAQEKRDAEMKKRFGSKSKLV